MTTQGRIMRRASRKLIESGAIPGLRKYKGNPASRFVQMGDDGPKMTATEARLRYLGGRTSKTTAPNPTAYAVEWDSEPEPDTGVRYFTGEVETDKDGKPLKKGGRRGKKAPKTAPAASKAAITLPPPEDKKSPEAAPKAPQVRTCKQAREVLRGLGLKLSGSPRMEKGKIVVRIVPE
jgi:hypothetical protein